MGLGLMEFCDKNVRFIKSSVVVDVGRRKETESFVCDKTDTWADRPRDRLEGAIRRVIVLHILYTCILQDRLDSCFTAACDSYIRLA